MRKLLFALLVVCIPWASVAQSERPVSALRQATDILGISTEQVLAVGVGVLAGAIGLHALMGGTAYTLVGGLGGALVGDWWFAQRGTAIIPVAGAPASLAVSPGK